MKLAVMKVICLLVLLGGGFLLGLVFDVRHVQLAYERAHEYWPRQDTGALNLRLPGMIAGVLCVVAGLYGLVPKIPKRKGKVISFKSEHGEIELQLKPIRKALLRMVRKMPEVYGVKLDVRPDADGHRACIEADVVLKNCAALGARKCSKMVAEYLASAARNVLGLEELSVVRVNVRGIHIDATAAGKQVREQLVLREDEEEEGYALAHSPISAVTLDGDSTENTGGVAIETAQDEGAEAQEGAAQVGDEDVEEERPAGETEDTGPEAVEVEAAPEAEEAMAAPADAQSTPPEAEEYPDEEQYALKQSAEPISDISLPPLMDDDDKPMPPAPQINLNGESAEGDSSGFSSGLDNDAPDIPEAEAIDVASKETFDAGDDAEAAAEPEPEDESEAESEDDAPPIEEEPPESRWT